MDAARESYGRAREALRGTTQDDSEGDTTQEYSDASLRSQFALHRLKSAEARLKDAERGDGRDTEYRRESQRQEDYWGSDDDVSGGGGGGGGGGGREYAVQDDGTVSFTEDGRSYTVSDEALANDVRDAARTGDASRLSTVDRVTVSDSQGTPVAANFDPPQISGEPVAAVPVSRITGGSNAGLRAAQEAWFRDQLASAPGPRGSRRQAGAAGVARRSTQRRVAEQGRLVHPRRSAHNRIAVLRAGFLQPQGRSGRQPNHRRPQRRAARGHGRHHDHLAGQSGPWRPFQRRPGRHRRTGERRQ